MPVVRFVCSEVGRGVQVIAGLSLVYIGVFVYRWTDGLYLAAAGLLPIATGLAGICPFACLFGCDLRGNPVSRGPIRGAFERFFLLPARLHRGRERGGGAVPAVGVTRRTA